MKILNAVTLWLSLAPAVLAVWVFWYLLHGYIIVSDNMNLIEFWTSVAILVLLVVTIILNVRRL